MNYANASPPNVLSKMVNERPGNDGVLKTRNIRIDGVRILDFESNKSEFFEAGLLQHLLGFRWTNRKRIPIG